MKKFLTSELYLLRDVDCYRFDRGYGPGVVRSKNSIIQGQWNRVHLHCNNWNGYLQLNDGPTAKGKPKVAYSHVGRIICQL